jgi:molecular chaperone DnaK
MNSERRALIFSDAGSNADILRIIRDAGLIPYRPQELANNAGPVSVIILDRPVENALLICDNLRRQLDYSQVPILVLLEAANEFQVAGFSRLGADLFFKPVGALALNRYLKNKILSSVKCPRCGALVPSEKAFCPNCNELIDAGQSSGATSDAQKAKPAPGAEASAPADGEQSGGKTEVLLGDLVPTSNRLLPTASVSTPIAKGGVPCAHCGRWRARREDAFCSKCGEPLTILHAPGEVVFEPFGAHRVGALVELKNAGQNPLRMNFRIPADGQLERRFALHTEEAILDGGHAEHLQVVFDARGLDLSTRYQTLLEIASNESGYAKRQVQLVIERLPIPRIVAEESYSFVLGVENQLEFRLANDGGGTLVLSKVYLAQAESAGVREFASELELPEPVRVRGGDSENVLAILPALDLPPGRYSQTMTCEFEHLPAMTIDVTVNVVRPARLAVQPPDLDFGVVSTRRSRRLPLTLVNSGGEELIVESITSSVEWMQFLIQTPVQIGAGGTQVFDVQVQGSLEIDGTHSGEITIHSNSYQSPIQAVPFLVKFVNPMDYEEYIGIDFGTTASCIAVLDKYDQPFALTLDTVEPGSQADARIMPSVLFFQEDGTVLAGREALNEAAIRPNNAVTSIKRVLGRKHKEKLAGREFDATELTSKIIEQLILRTEDGLFQLGEYKTPRRAVVTVPVEFFDNQRRALLEACELAGLETHALSKQGIVIDEAHAAALYYLSKKVQLTVEDKPERILIFDFGGGTLDCALIEIENAGDKVLFKTLAPGGDPRLGGEDIDWALVGLMADKAKQEYPDFDINCLGDEQKFDHNYRIPSLAEAAYRTRARFKRQAEVAKISLVSAPAIELSVQPLLRTGATPLEPFMMNGQGWARFDVTLMKEDLETVLEPFLRRAVNAVETLCQRAGIAPEDVHTILHVGRTSLLPLVRERINSLLPNAEDHSNLIEPKLCVALGAAFWGYIKDQPNANIEFVGGANRTIHDIGYIDTPVSSGNLRQVFVPVFPAQTEFPCEKVIEFSRAKEWLNLQLAENRGKNLVVEGTTEIKKIGKVRIDVRGVSEPTLAVRFAIDENRVLEITANGQTQTIEMMDE